MKPLHKFTNKSYIYINTEDKKKISKLIKSKELYNWRFVAPDQIPPYPPSTHFINGKKGKYTFVTDLNRKTIYRMYKKFSKNNEDFKKAHNSYFILTNKNNDISNPFYLPKKKFLKLVKKYLKLKDIDLIESITKNKFDKLLEEIKKVDTKNYILIQSNERWINLKKMNKMGLHLLRCLLAERIFQKKISYIKKNKDLNFFLKNGFLLKKYKTFKDEKIYNFLKKLSFNNKINKINWIESKVLHIKNDPQYTMHVDSFHNTFKVWMYPGNMKKKNGLLKFIPNSHLLSIAKLKWLYKISCSNKGIKEPSFRLEQKYYKFFKKSKVALPLNNEKTVVIANTFMFHCRDKSDFGTERISYRLRGDNDGGVKRYDVFL